jgi:hypothetical protein
MPQEARWGFIQGPAKDPKIGKLIDDAMVAVERDNPATDDQGHFTIESLDPTLLFRVLVLSKGFQPEFLSKIDAAIRPIEVTLKPSKNGQHPDREVKGKVIERGKTIAVKRLPGPSSAFVVSAGDKARNSSESSPLINVSPKPFQGFGDRTL